MAHIRSTSTEDPIFAAIEQHRAALAALATVDELTEPARYAAAEQKISATADVLFATPPRTPLGAKALVNLALDRPSCA